MAARAHAWPDSRPGGKANLKVAAAGMSPPLEITIVAPVPSPYQVELFNSLAAESSLRIHVLYLLKRHPDRLWNMSDIAHSHAFWDGGSAHQHIERIIDDADG